MYNRYIPENASYTQVEEESATAPKREESPHVGHGTPHPGPSQHPSGPYAASPGPHNSPGQHAAPGPQQTSQQGLFGPGGFKLPPFLTGKESFTSLFSGKERGGLSGLLKALHLEDIDTGDILLLLIILYLLVEGDDLELVIALGLVLIMGLGDKDDNKDE